MRDGAPMRPCQTGDNVLLPMRILENEMQSDSKVVMLTRRVCGLLMRCLLGGAIFAGPAMAAGQQAADPAIAEAAQNVPPAADQREAASPKQAHDNSYIIGNDDELAINVWKEVDLTRTVPVRSDGKISLPLVGEIQAAGQTPRELEIAIGSRLKSYVTDPEVTVIVQQVNSRKFNILGEVNKPGAYSLAVPTTIVDAIATAGGFRDFAKKKGVYILRQDAHGSVQRIHFNYAEFLKGKHPEQNIYLEPHDTVIVP